MHDANGTELKKGDVVILQCRIIDMNATEEHCNVRLETVLGRRPDDQKEKLDWLNTAQVVLLHRADE